MTKKKTAKAMTPESMLQAIIERQCAGGYSEWKDAIGKRIDKNGAIHFGVGQFKFSIASFLAVVLDPKGLRVVYKGRWCMGSEGESSYFWKSGQCFMRWKHKKNLYSYFFDKYAHTILDTWIETSSPEATIETAFSLLPTV